MNDVCNSFSTVSIRGPCYNIYVECIAKKVRSNFVTIDIARKDDGELMIMEFGDGQVSGLQQIEAKDFYQSFEREERVFKEVFF